MFKTQRLKKIHLENGQKRQEGTIYQRGYTNGKEAHKKMFDIISHQENKN